MTIRKGIITYTFMFDDKLNPVDEVNAMDLHDIMEECNTGHMLGLASWGDYNIVEVPNEKVVEEELAMGCDGAFFADPDARWDADNGQDGSNS